MRQQTALEYFNGDNLPADTWRSKYALTNLDDEVLEDNPDEMHKRMAKEFSRISDKYGEREHKYNLSKYGQTRGLLSEDKAYHLFEDFKRIIPQGSIMSALGDKYRPQSLSNCVILSPPYDSYSGISFNDEQIVQLAKRRCGIGFDISTLRPKGATVKNAAKTTSGAVSFVKRFSDSTNEVAQRGRRGALMISLDCRHPDVMEFIKLKDASDKVTGANISVRWRDDFVNAAKNNEKYTLRYPVESTPEEAEFTKEVDASYIWTQAAKYAHGYDQDKEENSTNFGGDPGCMFINRMREYATGTGYPNVQITSTNPCAEIGTQDNDSCRLIALNFMSAVQQPFKNNSRINYQTIEKLAYEQQVLLDNLIDLEIEHIDRIINKIKNDDEPEWLKSRELRTWNNLKENAINYRRTGGGFTALGDALAAVGVEYGSDEGNRVTEKMMRAKFRGEWNASIDMAIERGPFPEWSPEYDDTEFFDMMEEEFPEIYERNMEYGRRNISLSTVAPTGSVSLLANINGEYGTTSGIEPVFSTEENQFWHVRNKKLKEDSEEYDYVGDDGEKYKQYRVFHEGFRQWLNNYETDESFEPSDLTEEELKNLAKKSPYISAAGLEVEDRIKLQSIVQKYTSHSISSTLNLPEDSHWKDTLDIYQKGYELGLKGVTIFRTGCKRGVLQANMDEEGDGRGEQIEYHDAPERPKELEADLYQPRDKWLIAIGKLDGKPYEVFALREEELPSEFPEAYLIKSDSRNYSLTSKGESFINDILQYTPSSDVDVLTRFTSQLMRHGVKMDYIVEQVRKADITINDFSKILGDVLAQYTSEEYSMSCENCGSENLAYQEGCMTCLECGSSHCG